MRFFRPVRPVLALALVLPLAGCGDPPMHPSEAPVEIVLPDCVINRTEIMVGTHDFSAAGSGRVQVLSPARDELADLSGPDGLPVTLTITEPGTYTLHCVPETGQERDVALSITAS
ncbi:hypothetical protein [Nostocoides sp.]|uniref:hypothetical protein n=1 Tax=Nostocoides sp. TaxID=1917966 RepID=UPI002CE23743|nr:hypothetical protein [Tetrasphaera sp.]